MAPLCPALLIVAAACGPADGRAAPGPTPSGEASTPAVAATPTPAPTAALPSATPTMAPSPTPTARPSPTPTEPAALPEPPDRDLYDLARRLRPGAASGGPRVVNSAPVSYQAGSRAPFWVTDLEKKAVRRVNATLALVSDHAYWYVDDEVSIPAAALQRAAETFETRIRPAVVANIGDIWSPGVDNDPRLTILHTTLGAVAGYFGSADEYPAWAHPYSNEREMIYVDARRLVPGDDAYLGVLAHELQHAVHWNLDASEEAWLSEGMSEVAKELAGYPASFVDAFEGGPSVSLTQWPEDLGTSPAHYGASTLFVDYLAQHYGGYAGLGRLAAEPRDGIAGVDAYLSAYGTSFVSVFKDWVVANLLDRNAGPYGYPNSQVAVRPIASMPPSGTVAGRLPQFAARYVNLPPGGGDVALEFSGEAVVRQVGSDCRSGRTCWWSNRGDSMDSTLTRELDLAGLSTATLEFWTWFDIEEGWDYAYLEASTDGGRTWAIVPGVHTAAENPVGNSFGPGYTGSSGGWVQERIDLSPYAGQNVLLRFEYITDDAVSLDGFLVDDVSVPELGFADDAEADNGWVARGFARVGDPLPQRYAVQVVLRRANGEAEVRELALDDQQRGRMVIAGLGNAVESAVVVVAPITPGTLQPAPFTLTATPVDAGATSRRQGAAALRFFP